MTTYEDHVAVIGSSSAPKTFPSCAYAFVLGPRTLMLAVASPKGSIATWQGQIVHYRETQTVANLTATSNAVLVSNGRLR